MYEPVPIHFETARKNVMLNSRFLADNRSTIHVYNEAIHEEEKLIDVPYWGGIDTYVRESTTAFQVGSFGFTSLLGAASGKTGGVEKSRKIKTANLERVFERVDRPIGIVKLDCQGCEYDIFTDRNKRLLSRPLAYVIETHGREQSILQLLTSMGYHIVSIVPHAKTVKIIKAIKK